jgi:hypothetical protein
MAYEDHRIDRNKPYLKGLIYKTPRNYMQEIQISEILENLLDVLGLGPNNSK